MGRLARLVLHSLLGTIYGTNSIRREFGKPPSSLMMRVGHKMRVREPSEELKSFQLW